MRQLRLFDLKNNTVDQSDDCDQPLFEVAEEFLKIGRHAIEPFIKSVVDPNAKIKLNEELRMGMISLQRAAEIFMEIKKWNDAIFAWTMLQSVPIDDPKKQQFAQRQINFCQAQTGQYTTSETMFIPKAPSKDRTSSSCAMSQFALQK